MDARVPPGGRKGDAVPGGQGIDALDQSHGLHHRAEQQVASQGSLRKPRFDLTGGQERPDFGGKNQVAIDERVVERLDAQAIARQQNPGIATPRGLRRLGESKREHPLEVVHAILSPFFVRVDDDLRVALRLEMIAAGFQRVAKLLEVIDLPVEYDDDGSVLIEHGLMSAAEVDDAEAAHTQGYRVVDKDALVVGATMMHLPQHLPHDALRRLRIRAADYSADSTHGLLFRSIQEGAP